MARVAASSRAPIVCIKLTSPMRLDFMAPYTVFYKGFQGETVEESRKGHPTTLGGAMLEVIRKQPRHDSICSGAERQT